MSALFNWFQLVHGPFWTKQHAQHTRFLPRIARKESNIPMLSNSSELTILIYSMIYSTAIPCQNSTFSLGLNSHQNYLYYIHHIFCYSFEFFQLRIPELFLIWVYNKSVALERKKQVLFVIESVGSIIRLVFFLLSRSSKLFAKMVFCF